MAHTTNLDFALALQLEQDDITEYLINDEDKDLNLKKENKTITILSNKEIQILVNNGIQIDELLILYPNNKHIFNKTHQQSINFQNIQKLNSIPSSIICGYIRKHFILSMVSSPVINLCVKYLQFIFDTIILTPKEENMMDQIFKNKFSTTNIKYDLLYRASEHKYSADKFHELCDGESSIVVIIKNEYGHIFGGYCHYPFIGDFEEAIFDDNAFLFLLRSANNIKIPKLYKLINSRVKGKYAVYYDQLNGPIFGCTCYNSCCAISIVDECDQFDNNHCSPSNDIFETENSGNELCGGNNLVIEQGSDGIPNEEKYCYKVLEYEVFKVREINPIHFDKKELLIYGYIRRITFVPSCIINLCTQYLLILFWDTKILNLDEELYLKGILKQKRNINFDDIESRLLYRASDNEYAASLYHKLCDNIVSTVVIIQTEYGHIFGGYCWGKPEKVRYCREKNAFLFLLRSTDKTVKLPKVYGNCVAQWQETRGPCFMTSDGYDIEIMNMCNEYCGGYCRPDYGDIYERNELCGGNNYDWYDGDHWMFKVVEYEVFQIM